MEIQKICLLVPWFTNFADVSIFLQKLSIFGKNSTFTQSDSVGAVFVSDFFGSAYIFCKVKGYY